MRSTAVLQPVPIAVELDNIFFLPGLVAEKDDFEELWTAPNMLPYLIDAAEMLGPDNGWMGGKSPVFQKLNLKLEEGGRWIEDFGKTLRDVLGDSQWTHPSIGSLNKHFSCLYQYRYLDQNWRRYQYQ